MADVSTTTKKRLMIVICASSNHGKTSSLEILREELKRSKYTSCTFSYRHSPDATYVIRYRGVTIGISPAGDNPKCLIKGYHRVGSLLNQHSDELKICCDKRTADGRFLSDIYITAAHYELLPIMKAYADMDKYNLNTQESYYVVGGEKKQWKNAWHQCAKDIKKRIDDFISDLKQSR